MESVKVYEGKKRVVWEQNKLLEGTQLTLSLGLSAGSVRPPRACTRKRKAARALTFTNPNPNPRKRGKEGKEDEGQSGKKTKGPKKQTPAPVLKQTVEKKAQAGAFGQHGSPSTFATRVRLFHVLFDNVADIKVLDVRACTS